MSIVEVIRMINVCYALTDVDGTYYEQLGASIISLCDKNKDNINIFIITDSTLSNAAQNHLLAISKYTHCSINFIYINSHEELTKYVDPQCIEKHSYATMYRLYIDQIFPEYIDKIIYLDADTIINCDICNIWMTDLEDITCAAVLDLNIFRNNEAWKEWVKSITDIKNMDAYVNAGVLIFNLDRLRKKYHFYDDAMNYFKNNPKSFFGDQDAINSIFGNNNDLKILPYEYNQYVVELKKNPTSLSDGIYHWAAIRSKNKHEKIGNNIYDDLYWTYYSKFMELK
jgi:lipopolysaccharide biosynthesis glycosyltransferase